MKYKMLALDVDGTLLNKDHQLTKESIDAIRKLKKKGIKVILVTGREFAALKNILDELELEDIVVTQNGSVILSCDGKTSIKEKLISRENCMRIISYCKENNIRPLLYQKKGVYSEITGQYLGIFEKCMDQKVIFCNDILSSYEGEPLGKILILDDPEVVSKAKRWLEETFEGTVSAELAYDFSLEIGGSSKVEALKWVADFYDIKSEQIIAIGDGENDREMLKYAGLGVAMGNAMNSVKKSANEVTLSNDENGVAYAISRWM